MTRYLGLVVLGSIVTGCDAWVQVAGVIGEDQRESFVILDKLPDPAALPDGFRPVSGARVRFLIMRNGQLEEFKGTHGATKPVYSDEQGRFAIETLYNLVTPPWDSIEIVKEGYQSARIPFSGGNHTYFLVQLVRKP